MGCRDPAERRTTRALRPRAPAVNHWSADDWKMCHDVKTHDTGIGIHLVDLATQKLAEGKQIQLTFYWPDAKRWEGADFVVHIATAAKGGSKAHEQ